MWKIASGYVIIHVRGLSLERFLNLMLREGIRAWDVQRCSRTELRLCIPSKDFEKLPKIRRKCHCSIHIERRHGAPFFIARLWKRKVLCFGLAAAFLAICFLSTRIWFIRYLDADAEGISEKLKEQGLVVGAAQSGEDWSHLASELTAKDGSLKWLGLRQQGVFVEVESIAAKEKAETVDYSKTCEIIALKAGMITKVNCFRGQAAVKVGDRVNAGDVLISDTVVYLDFPPYFTHADGEVFAAMQYSASLEVPRVITELVPSTNTERYFKVLCCGKVIFESKSSFSEYEMSELTTISVTEMLFPLTVVRGEYIELQEVERALTEEEGKSWAAMLVERQALDMVPKEAVILVKSCYFGQSEQGLTAFCTITTEEKIGIQRETMHE